MLFHYSPILLLEKVSDERKVKDRGKAVVSVRDERLPTYLYERVHGPVFYYQIKGLG